MTAPTPRLRERPARNREDVFMQRMSVADTPVKKLRVATDFLCSAAKVSDPERVPVILTPLIHSIVEAAQALLSPRRRHR